MFRNVQADMFGMSVDAQSEHSIHQCEDNPSADKSPKPAGYDSHRLNRELFQHTLTGDRRRSDQGDGECSPTAANRMDWNSADNVVEFQVLKQIAPQH